MAPVEIVKQGRANVSDAELYAWRIAIARARDGCAARSAVDYHGEDLFDLARLCSLAQDQPATRKALVSYLADPSAPHREDAEVMLIHGEVTQGKFDDARKMAANLLDEFPFDALIHASIQEVLDVLRTVQPDAAIALAQKRLHPLLLALHHGRSLPSHDKLSELRLPLVFHDGLQLAASLYRRGNQTQATAMLEEMREAVAANPDLKDSDRDAISQWVRQFDWLGKKPPAIGAMRVYSAGRFLKPEPTLTASDRVTVFLFVPVWCQQCVEFLPALLAVTREKIKQPVTVYGITAPSWLAGDDATAPPRQLQFFNKNLGSIHPLPPVVLASDVVFHELAVNAYPTMLVLGRDGAIRFLDAVPDTAIDKSDYLVSVVTAALYGRY